MSGVGVPDNNTREEVLARWDSMIPPVLLNMGITFAEVPVEYVPQLILGRTDEQGIYHAGTLVQGERDGPYSGAITDFVTNTGQIGEACLV